MKLFEIWFSTPEGEEKMAFTWTKSAEEGIEKARADAESMGVEVDDVWATPVRAPKRVRVRKKSSS